jgi:hypothetical protein
MMAQVRSRGTHRWLGAGLGILAASLLLSFLVNPHFLVISGLCFWILVYFGFSRLQPATPGSSPLNWLDRLGRRFPVTTTILALIVGMAALIVVGLVLWRFAGDRLWEGLTTAHFSARQVWYCRPDCRATDWANDRVAFSIEMFIAILMASPLVILALCPVFFIWLAWAFRDDRKRWSRPPIPMESKEPDRQLFIDEHAGQQQTRPSWTIVRRHRRPRK